MTTTRDRDTQPVVADRPPGGQPYRVEARESADDPRVTLEQDVGVFEPVPPFPPRTEREAEFYTLADGEMLILVGESGLQAAFWFNEAP